MSIFSEEIELNRIDDFSFLDNMNKDELEEYYAATQKEVDDLWAIENSVAESGAKERLSKTLERQTDLMNKTLCAEEAKKRIGHKGSVFKTGSPKDFAPPPKGEITAECIVQFRPHNYNGDYGFDWFRLGDNGDNKFEDIIGYHYNLVKVKKKENNQTNSKPQKHEIPKLEPEMKVVVSDGIANGLDNIDPFQLDVKKLEIVKYREYERLVTYKKDEDEGRYYIPTLTLMKGRTAELRLLVEFKDENRRPQKITLEFDDTKANEYLKLDKTEIADNNEILKITCAEEFGREQVLNVKADGKLCGRLRILANDKAHQRNIKVLVIIAKTIDNRGKDKYGQLDNFNKESFTKVMNQALIVPEIIMLVDDKGDDIFLDCTHAPIKHINGVIDYGDMAWMENNQKLRIQNIMDKSVHDQFGNKYDDCYKIYIMGEAFSSSDAFSYPNTKFAIMSKKYREENIPHELLHCLGLHHTFDFSNHSAYKAPYACQFSKTDNFLDYYNMPEFLYLWQCKIINSKL